MLHDQGGNEGDEGPDAGAGSTGGTQGRFNRANLVGPSEWIPKVEEYFPRQVFKPMPRGGYPPVGVMRPSEVHRARSTKKQVLKINPIEWDEDHVWCKGANGKPMHLIGKGGAFFEGGPQFEAGCISLGLGLDKLWRGG